MTPTSQQEGIADVFEAKSKEKSQQKCLLVFSPDCNAGCSEHAPSVNKDVDFHIFKQKLIHRFLWIT